MSVYPVSQALIPPDWQRDPPIVPRLLIFHTAVSNAKAPGPSAPDANGLEWHFYVAESGEIVQRRDTGEEADANYHANSFLIDGVRYGAISVETWDGGDPEANPWNPAQLDSIVKLCKLAHDNDGVPLHKATEWNGSGVGYHRMFPEWDHPYHSCPGDTRADQFDDVVLPRITQQDEDNMTDGEKDMLFATLADLNKKVDALTASVGVSKKRDDGTYEDTGIAGAVHHAREEIKALQGK